MEQGPYIKASENVTELTVKAVLLGAVLSMVLAGANAYLGLFAGMTVSASIPAAVISMAILKFFKNSSILENNAVQTAASAGESLAAGVIFTFPALVLMGYWSEFNFWQCTLISGCGGILGVLFTVPLRKALIVRQKLQFPEGVATSEVLKSGEEGGKSVKFLVISSLIGALFKFAASGGKLWHEVLDIAAIKGKAFLYFGMNLSPALMAVGYIVGLNISFLVFLGGAISWWVAIPAYLAVNGIPADVDAVDLGYKVWNSQIRYLGVGAMIVGGLWALISIRESLVQAVSHGIEAFKNSGTSKEQEPRTERDTPMKWVVLGSLLMVVPVFFIYQSQIQSMGISLFMAALMVFAGFLFAAVAGYMAGLVGSSNNPISGVTIATILCASLLLLALLGAGSAKGPAAAILIGAVVCCAAAIAGDNMQDLKSGYILGATPIKQQIMQVVGVLASAMVMAPVLTLLNTAYGFGPKTAANPDSLTAPQATLMQSVAEGVFGGNLPWTMISMGAVIGVIIIIMDEILRKKGSEFRMPVLAVAIGIYLPFELDSAIMLGGLLAWILSRYHKKQGQAKTENHAEAQRASGRAGLLFASGLITGEALVGIVLAIPIAITGSNKVLALMDKPIGVWPGILGMALVCAYLVHVARKSYRTYGQ